MLPRRQRFAVLALKEIKKGTVKVSFLKKIVNKVVCSILLSKPGIINE